MSEDSLQEQGLSFHHVGPGNWSQVVKVAHVGSCLLDIVSLASKISAFKNDKTMMLSHLESDLYIVGSGENTL